MGWFARVTNRLMTIGLPQPPDMWGPQLAAQRQRTDAFATYMETTVAPCTPTRVRCLTGMNLRTAPAYNPSFAEPFEEPVAVPVVQQPAFEDVLAAILGGNVVEEPAYMVFDLRRAEVEK